MSTSPAPLSQAWDLIRDNATAAATLATAVEVEAAKTGDLTTAATLRAALRDYHAIVPA